MNVYYKIKCIKNSNFIIGEIDIKEKDINKEIRFINDYKEPSIFLKDYLLTDYNEQIKKFCEIKIVDKIIPFSYFYKFGQKGKYIIKYSFNQYLTKTNYMFLNCENLIYIDMSNLNTKRVTDKSYMFYGCKSLNELILIQKMLQK